MQLPTAARLPPVGRVGSLAVRPATGADLELVATNAAPTAVRTARVVLQGRLRSGQPVNLRRGERGIAARPTAVIDAGQRQAANLPRG